MKLAHNQLGENFHTKGDEPVKAITDLSDHHGVLQNKNEL